MSYVDSQLVQHESVRYRAHLSRVMFVVPYAIVAIGIAFLVGSYWTPGYLWPGIVTAALGAIVWGFCRLVYVTSEFAVTNKRVIIKVGWVHRRTIETMLSKIEGIGVDQDLLGRMLNYGSILVTGTGGTKERFTKIAKPLEFRRQVQDAIAAAEEVRAAPATAAVGSGADRVERDCPFCAERILVKAKICKHCGREVPPMGSPTT